MMHTMLPSAPLLLPGQLRIYARKSTASENASKSIEDQVAECLDLCEELGLPGSDADVRTEAVGLGGDLWFRGGGYTGIGVAGAGQKIRPVLSDIVEDVVAGRCRAIMVFAYDRLFRSVGIATAIVELCKAYKVMLYDRTGPCDVTTIPGEQKIINDAVASQHYRQTVMVTSPRGVRRQIKKRALVGNSNALGFRSNGRHSKTLRHILEEQEVVRQIFVWYDTGLYSLQGIADKLMDDGFQFLPDLVGTRGKKRNEHTIGKIYDWQIRHVLTDVRYIGKQPHGGKEYDCDAYLHEDGSTVVDVALFERVQQKFVNLDRAGNAIRKDRALTALMRCGLCGQPLHLSGTTVTHQDGSITRPKYWKTVKTEVWCWCTHSLPSLSEEVVDEYLDTILAPLALAEIREKSLSADNAKSLAKVASIRQELKEQERIYNEELPDCIGKLPAQLVAEKEQRLRKRIGELNLQLCQAEQELRTLDDVAETLASLSTATPIARADAFRAVIRWVALLPSLKPREPDPKRSDRSRPNTDAGRLVFLTQFGLYHTAQIVKERSEGKKKRANVLRPATAVETAAGVADFPDPRAFLAGLERSWAGGKYPYRSADVAPGYVGDMQLPIAEFAVNISHESNKDAERSAM